MSCSVINTTKYKNLFFCRQSKTAYGQKNVVLIRGKDRFLTFTIPLPPNASIKSTLLNPPMAFLLFTIVEKMDR